MKTNNEYFVFDFGQFYERIQREYRTLVISNLMSEIFYLVEYVRLKFLKPLNIINLLSGFLSCKRLYT